MGEVGLSDVSFPFNRKIGKTKELLTFSQKISDLFSLNVLKRNTYTEILHFKSEEKNVLRLCERCN